jgi:hypothetical protein
MATTNSRFGCSSGYEFDSDVDMSLPTPVMNTRDVERRLPSWVHTLGQLPGSPGERNGRRVERPEDL